MLTATHFRRIILGMNQHPIWENIVAGLVWTAPPILTVSGAALLTNDKGTLGLVWAVAMFGWVPLAQHLFMTRGARGEPTLRRIMKAFDNPDRL